jgi:pyroglutamyl-peptidase
MNIPGNTDDVVIAAFEPFDGRRTNRAWQTVQRLPARAGLEKIQLPVQLAPLRASLGRVLARRPKVLLLLGESPAPLVLIEQVALNVFDADRIPVQRRMRPTEPIEPQGQLARSAPWDARAIAAAISRAGVPAAASFHAGTFACNASLYLALGAQPAPRVGFVHLPRHRWPRGPRLGKLVRAAELALAALCAG